MARTAAFGRGDSWTPTSDKTAQLRGGVPRRAVAFLQVPLESGLRCLTSPTVPDACGTSKALCQHRRSAVAGSCQPAPAQRVQ